jgi:hypothetical protein
LAVKPAAEAVAAESALLRGLAAGGWVEEAALAVLAFALGGESGFFDFINDGVREACHKAGTISPRLCPPATRKFPDSP